ncbi:MBL fold metallo-hydrolase [Rathayibacter sp. YIM 133350]|uniref:MBL fold metallo-hydrolase n=1 Tax=Rathayibacter sp. YIM 133350 TaxID=3131992 RepID=UPI00307F1C94
MTESTLTRTVLAPNAGPMTLEGTNSYVIGRGDRVVVVDPGPLDMRHLDELAATTVELILVTHHHADHVEGVPAFAEHTGAPVRALDPALCIDAEPLIDGEVIDAAGVSIRVLTTPGHTADSVCFHLPDDGENGSVLTGDTILGRGTTIIADPDGGLGPYLHSLGRLREVGPALVLPGHGPALENLTAICDAYLAHRAERLTQVEQAVAHLGEDASVESVTDLVYADADAAVRPAAEASVRAQLTYLRQRAEGTLPPAD